MALAPVQGMSRLARIFVASLVTLLAGSAVAEPPADAPSPATSETSAAPPASAAHRPRVAKVPLRVVKILVESEQALLFDKNRGRHVLVEVGETVGDYVVEAIDVDDVTLTGKDAETVVLAAPERPWRRDRPAASPVPATTAGEATPEDPYAAPALDDLGEVRSVSAAGLAGTPGALGEPELDELTPYDETGAPIPARTMLPPAPTATPGMAPTTIGPSTAASTIGPTAAAPSATTTPTPGMAPTTIGPGTSGLGAPPTMIGPSAAAPSPAAPPTTIAPSAPPAPSVVAPPVAPGPALSPLAAALAAEASSGTPPATAPASPTAIPATAAAVAPAPGSSTVTLARRDVDAALGNFGALASSMQASIGKAGVELRAVGAGSVFARAGLRAGDVITAVDGKPLRSLDDAADLYARAGTLKSATVQLLRAGRPHTLRITIQ